MKKYFFLGILSLLTCGAPAFSQSVYMKVEGAAKAIKGESGNAGHTDQTELLSFNFEVASPRDASSGLGTGKRAYKPVTVYKQSGLYSPLFFDALVTNAIIPKIIIEVYRADAVYKGIETKGTIITLENVSVSSYRILNGLSGEYSKAKPDATYDELKFVFQKITIEDASSRLLSTDNWQNVR